MSVRGTVSCLVGFLLGAAFGGLGIVVTRLNEQHFGALYSRYRWEWLAIPSLPGEIVAEWRQGYDWRFGEWWFHRYEIVGWNAVLWGAAWLAVAVFWKLRRHLARVESPRNAAPN